MILPVLAAVAVAALVLREVLQVTLERRRR